LRIKHLGVVLAASAVFALPAVPAEAAARTVPLAAGQQPENLTLEPDGSADLTFAYTGEIGRVSPGGRVTIIGRIPIPADGDVPVVHQKLFLGGIVRAPGGDLYVAVSTGTAATGLYRIRPGQAPVQVAALPPSGFQNGVARDPATGDFFVADSFNSTVWRVSRGRVTAWATGELLAPVSGFGANGVKVHDGALWVSNLDRGTLVRFPLRGGPGRVVTSGLGPVDDFAFHGDTVVAAINQDNRVVTIGRDGTRTILSTEDGLANPTAVAVRDNTLYVTDGAYFGGSPNLLQTTLAANTCNAELDGSVTATTSLPAVSGTELAKTRYGVAG
jgi:sugar lactone lactonase YvrE